MLVPNPMERQPLRYGLLQAALGPFDLPIHARNGGLQFVSSICGEGVGYEIECIDDQNSKADAFGLGTATILGAPFMVFATLVCPAVGYTPQELEGLVVEKLKSVEQAVVEEIFSTSTFGQAPGLVAGDGIVTLAGAGDTSTQVLSELERAMYCGTGDVDVAYGPRAVIHIPIPLLNDLKERRIIEFDGTRWRTPMGTTVSAGCYANNDPDGAAPADGVFWMYITGQTAIWRTPDSAIQTIPIEGALNRTTNQVLMLAEREYVVAYECEGFAKPVTLWT